MSILDDLRAAVVEGRVKEAAARQAESLEAGLPAGTLLREGLISAMQEIGQLFEEGEVFVPEMMVAARAMSPGLAVLRPLLLEQGVKASGTVAIGTNRGTFTTSGTTSWRQCWKAQGLRSWTWTWTPRPRSVQAIRDGAAVVAMSALLTSTVTNMQTAIGAIREAGLREQVRIVIGGAPITKTYADEIGADGYAIDASSAARLVREVLAS